MPPPVSVVIVTWNGRGLLERFLPSVLASDYPRLEVVVADNASTDGTAEWVGETHPEAVLVRHPTNGMFARGNNEAVPHSSGEVLVFLNNDVEVPPGWLGPLITAFDDDVTTPRRRSNHCEIIVRDVRVSRPCPVKRRQPKPRLITPRPTAVDIGPTVLKPTSVNARPPTAAAATRRDPKRSMARPPCGSTSPLLPVPMRYAIDNSSRLRPVVVMRLSVKTLTPAVWPGTEATTPMRPTTSTTQP